MGCIRPATPGFLVTLVATALLAVVSFCVPYFKSVYFLRADITVGGNNGSITFGTLGYCIELPNGTTCSSPSIGYQLDINGLVGNRFSVEIPQVAVKWLTYALFLHIVALILAAGSAVFGLLAHVREISMACCSTCISGFAAGVALLAFIFDIALFFLAKARINAVGRATIGNAIWLTLAAWILLFFSGCFYTLGRCCISKRGPKNKWNRDGDREGGRQDDGYAERMRLDAIKAEEDRKALQKSSSKSGLPAFYETQPLTGHIEGGSVYTDKTYKENDSTSHGSGYAPAPAGSRAVDEYYTPSPQNTSPTMYPPRPPTHPERQNSTTYTPSSYNQNISVAAPQRQGSGFAPTHNNTSNFLNTQPTPPPTTQYLYDDPYLNVGHGHTGGSSYYSATSHNQQPSSNSQYGYVTEPQPQYSQPSFSADAYNMTSSFASPPMPLATTTPSSNPYLYNTQSPPVHNYAPERAYTLGGDGYGTNSVPPLPENYDHGYGASSTNYPGPTNTEYVAAPLSPVKGPHPPPSHSHSGSSDAPPGYEIGVSGMNGQWGKP